MFILLRFERAKWSPKYGVLPARRAKLRRQVRIIATIGETSHPRVRSLPYGAPLLRTTKSRVRPVLRSPVHRSPKLRTACGCPHYEPPHPCPCSHPAQRFPEPSTPVRSFPLHFFGVPCSALRTSAPCGTPLRAVLRSPRPVHRTAELATSCGTPQYEVPHAIVRRNKRCAGPT